MFLIALCLRLRTGLLPAALLGCGGSTGPARASELAGVWDYRASDLTFRNGTTCELSYVLTLQQRDDVFVGFASDGHLRCDAADQTTSLRTVTVNDGHTDSELDGRYNFTLGRELVHIGELSDLRDGEGTGRAFSDNLFDAGPAEGTFTLVRQR